MAARNPQDDPSRDRDDMRDEAWDDRDDPLEQDMDDDDDGDESPLEECPRCRREISGWAERCPYCGNEDLTPASRHGPWVRQTGIALLVVLLVGTGVVTWLIAWVNRSLRG